MTTQRRRPYTPTTHEDRTLRPILKQHTATGTAPDRVLLAILCKAFDAGIPAYRARAWVRHRTGDVDILTFTSDARAWSRLVRAARQHVRDSTSAQSREAQTVRAVRATLIHALTNPLPRSDQPLPHARSIQAARHLLLHLGHAHAHHTARTGWPTLLTWRTALTVPLGVSRQAIAGRLRTAETLGWIRIVRARGDGGTILRPGRVTAAQVDQLTDEVAAAVNVVTGEVAGVLLSDPREHDALRDAASPAVRLVLSAGHAVWAHDDAISWTTLLVLLADAVGVDPAGLIGVSKAAARSARQLAKTCLGWDGTGDGLEAALNARGAAGAFNAYRAAIARRETEKAATTEARARDTVVRGAVRQIVEDLGWVPGPDDNAEKFANWRTSLTADVAGLGLDRHQTGVARREIRGRLERVGWVTDDARSLAELITGA